MYVQVDWALRCLALLEGCEGIGLLFATPTLPCTLPLGGGVSVGLPGSGGVAWNSRQRPYKRERISKHAIFT